MRGREASHADWGTMIGTSHSERNVGRKGLGD